MVMFRNIPFKVGKCTHWGLVAWKIFPCTDVKGSRVHYSNSTCNVSCLKFKKKPSTKTQFQRKKGSDQDLHREKKKKKKKTFYQDIFFIFISQIENQMLVIIHASHIFIFSFDNPIKNRLLLLNFLIKC